MIIRYVFAVMAIIFLIGCVDISDSNYSPITIAVATLHPIDNNSVEGVVLFIKELEGMQVVGTIEGLSPGMHGFHIHELGDCSAPDASSAGGHFNPFDTVHGDRLSNKTHVGDLGNIEADSEGIADFEFIDPNLDFYGKSSIIGRAVIVHEGEDDLVSGPTGASGNRITCGVIGISKED